MPNSPIRQALTREIPVAAIEQDLESLEANLLLISRRWSAVIDEVSAPLPSMQYAILRLVVFLEEVPLRDLAEALNLDASTVSRHVATLVSLEYLAREVNEGDKRQALITVTDAGRMESERIRLNLLGVARGVLAELSSSEKRIAALGASVLRNTLISR